MEPAAVAAAAAAAAMMAPTPMELAVAAVVRAVVVRRRRAAAATAPAEALAYWRLKAASKSITRFLYAVRAALEALAGTLVLVSLAASAALQVMAPVGLVEAVMVAPVARAVTAAAAAAERVGIRSPF